MSKQPDFYRDQLDRAFFDVYQHDDSQSGWWRVRMLLGSKWWFSPGVFVSEDAARASVEKCRGPWMVDAARPSDLLKEVE